MGRSLNINHVLNADKLTKAQFKKQFTDIMKAKGYTSAKEEDAELCYELVFSADRKWVTILSEDDNDAKNKASAFARDLGMQVLSVELVDSDFAELTLFGKNGTPADTMFLGEPYFDEVPEPSPLKWQTMLGIDWAKVEEIQQGDHTFAEDALCEFGEVIGCENMLAEYGNEGDNAVRVYFKKAGEKKLTLNAAFKQVFGPELESRGFKLIKGSNVYFRVLNSEIVQLVTVVKEKNNPSCLPVVSTGIKTNNLGYKTFSVNSHDHFNVVCCIKSIYDEIPFKPDKLSLDYTFYDNCNILKKSVIKIDSIIFSDIMSFTYQKDNNESLIAAMKYNLEISKKVMFISLENVDNIDNYLKYVLRENRNYEYGICLIYRNYKDILQEYYEYSLNEETMYYNNSTETDKEERFNANKQRIEKSFNKRYKLINSILFEEEKRKRYEERIEHNKNNNLEILKENGIIINEENEDEEK